MIFHLVIRFSNLPLIHFSHSFFHGLPAKKFVCRSFGRIWSLTHRLHAAAQLQWGVPMALLEWIPQIQCSCMILPSG